jgi:putative aldouronate transport system permease protein
MHQQSLSERLFSSLNAILLTGFAFLAVYPFLYTLSISLSTASEAAREGLHLLPREISVTAYQMILRNPEILAGYANTLFRTIAGTLATLFFTCLCSYPLSRRYMPHRRIYTFLVMFTMLFSGGVVPMYLLMKNLHLIDNRLVYILPLLTSAFNVVIVKNFFQQLPESLAESAKIDGANEFRILFSIYMPLSKPVLATLALWTAVTHWNMWFDALIYINSDSKQVLQTFLQRVVIDSSTALIEKGVVNPDVTQFTPETVKAATVVVTMLPVLLIYPFIQKYFVKGIVLGGVKE